MLLLSFLCFFNCSLEEGWRSVMYCCGYALCRLGAKVAGDLTVKEMSELLATKQVGYGVKSGQKQ